MKRAEAMHERVLDVGCGDGLLTRAAARMLPLGYAVRSMPRPG